MLHPKRQGADQLFFVSFMHKICQEKSCSNLLTLERRSVNPLPRREFSGTRGSEFKVL
jgi:hypothetical protein